MAIFTVTSNAVENVDIFISSSFKAGMALMRDDNGRGVAADSQLLISKTIEQKFGKFLGFATSDHTSVANTIIIPDVIGSSYIDNSYNFIRTENNEVAVSKRAVNDYLNEGVNSLFNPSDSSVISKRGMAVYNQPNNIFITDQFKAVLHGDYGLDGLDTVALNPGDLLTFGGGINAGKLVKVNVNSFGPDILVVGIVEKYIASTNLLHFRQVNYSLSFGTNPYIFSADPGNRASYSLGSTTTLNLANVSNSATLLNGTSYSSVNGGVWSFDGTDDGINTAINIDNDPIGIHAWVYCTEVTSTGGRGIVLSDNGGWDRGIEIYNSQWGVHTGSSINQTILGAVSNNTWYNVFLSYVSNVWTLYVNGSLIGSGASNPSGGSLATIGRADYVSSRIFRGFISQVNIYNRGLTVTEITNYYNATKSRYGL
jgi:hypothetical protein